MTAKSRERILVHLNTAHTHSFTKSLRDCVSTSDRIGYIYWFFVLITISCGGATGVFVTHRNRTAMERVCADKLVYYADNYGGNKMPAPAPRKQSSPADDADDADERLRGAAAVQHLGAEVLEREEAVHVRVAAIEDRLK